MPKSREARIQYANNEILGKGNLRIIDELFAADYVVHISGGSFRALNS